VEPEGGTIRIHDGATQENAFKLLGISPEVARERFGFLLDALRSGAPPHGGIALGIDRWVILFGKLDSIRDVIALPRTQKASDLLTGAPSPVEAKQLAELGIRVVVPPPKPTALEAGLPPADHRKRCQQPNLAETGRRGIPILPIFGGLHLLPQSQICYWGKSPQ
jgi:hypothetical protein